MERLFTNITNEELTQNNNDLHTGCYAGEREDFMMNGIYMTENGLKAENVPVKIALDHGWSSIKGEHIFMETSVVPVDYTPLERIKKDALPKLKCEIPEDDIIDVIRGKQSNVNAEFLPFIEKGLQQYADEVEAKLREIKVDLLHENIVYVGGGACVMKRFGRTLGRNIQYVTDVKANAIGYRYLAENLG